MNLFAYMFIGLLFVPSLTPMTIAIGQFRFTSDASVHLVAFGTGLAVGLVYFANLRTRRYG